MLGFFGAYVAWVLSLMLSIEPPRKGNDFYELARQIAIDSLDPLPDPYDTPERTSALLVAVAWHESRFMMTPPKSFDGLPTSGPFQAYPADSYMRQLRYSLTVCHDLTFYVSGKCGKAPKTAVYREWLAARLLARHAASPVISLYAPQTLRAGHHSDLQW